MRSQLSTRMLAAMHAQSTGEVILPLIKLTQAGWAESICIVPNTESVTHAGDVYEPLAFDVKLPDEEAEGVPVVAWAADNVDQRMIAALRAVSGVVDAQIVWVLAGTPEVIEMGPLNVEMRAAQYDANTISGTMGVEPILDHQFGHLIMSPSVTPALF
jgi:Domain of unknown function (DUF1833)